MMKLSMKWTSPSLANHTNFLPDQEPDIEMNEINETVREEPPIIDFDFDPINMDFMTEEHGKSAK